MKSQITKKLVKITPIVLVLLFVLANTTACVPRVYAQGCGGLITANGTFAYDTWFFGVIPWHSSAQTAESCQYTFKGTVGQYVSIMMQRDDYSPALIPYLVLNAPPLRGQTIGTTVARIDNTTIGEPTVVIDSYRLPSTGVYTIIASSYQDTSYGKFWLYVSLYQ